MAILREKIELSQKELAKLLQCSLATIQSIETGRLKLSETRAQRISFETGVDLGWLQQNDTTTAPVKRNRKLYTKDDFDQRQKELSMPQTGDLSAEIIKARLVEGVTGLCKLYLLAFGKGRFDLFQFEVQQSLKLLISKASELEPKAENWIVSENWPPPKSGAWGKDAHLDLAPIADHFTRGLAAMMNAKELEGKPRPKAKERAPKVCRIPADLLSTTWEFVLSYSKGGRWHREIFPTFQGAKGRCRKLGLGWIPARPV